MHTLATLQLATATVQFQVLTTADNHGFITTYNQDGSKRDTVPVIPDSSWLGIPRLKDIDFCLFAASFRLEHHWTNTERLAIRKYLLDTRRVDYGTLRMETNVEGVINTLALVHLNVNIVGAILSTTAPEYELEAYTYIDLTEGPVHWNDTIRQDEDYLNDIRNLYLQVLGS